MEQGLIVSKNKTLNIFQRIRLRLFLRRDFTYEDYIKAPEYIREQYEVVANLLRKNNLDEKQFLSIPEYQLLECFKNGIAKQKIKDKVPQEIQIKWLKSGEIQTHVLHILYDSEERNALLLYAIKRGDNEIIKVFDGYDTEDFLQYMENEGILDNYLPGLIAILPENIRNELLKSKPELLCELKKDDQIKVIIKNEKMLQYSSMEVQLQYIEDDPKKFYSKCSKEAKKQYIKQNINNILRLDLKNQIELVEYNPRFFEFISTNAQNAIFENPKENKKAIISLLLLDLSNSKHLTFIDGKDLLSVPNILEEYYERIKEMDDKQKIDFVLHSKMMSAIGSLTPDYYAFHITDGGVGGEEIRGIDGYVNVQNDIIQSMDINTILQLLSIDSNYILPYVARLDDKNRCVLTSEERIKSQSRCEQLFLQMYGMETYENYKRCINTIYEMQMKQNKLISTPLDIMSMKKDEDIPILMEQGIIPLEEFKLLFNERVINSNSPEIIYQYLQAKNDGEDSKSLFRQIIVNSYGERAGKILDSRPNLDIHSINSLEVFDSRILDEYGEAFVHDCISYNIRDFSEFLEIVKNEQKRNRFRTYYDTLVSIYGNNADTMQKAISEYSYIEALLEQTENAELTEEQYTNLISVFCSRRNPYNITTLSDLQNYDEIANQKLKKQILAIKNKDFNQLKELICESFFGMRFKNNNSINYGECVEDIVNLYDLDSNDGLNDDEKRMIHILQFIGQTYSFDKLNELADLLMKERGIRNPIVLQTSLQKIRSVQFELLNDSLTTVDKLRAQCEAEKGLENPSVYFEENDGLQFYHLTGSNFTFLTHQSYIESDDIMEYDGQAGNTAICTRVINQENGRIDGRFIYTSIDEDMLIGSHSHDAKTTHIKKRVKNNGRVSTKLKDIHTLATKDRNEVSFYRRYRNHDKIDNTNSGGRRLPDAYGKSSKRDLTPKEIEFCKKYHIPIIVVHYDEYNDKEIVNQQDKEMEV